MVGWPATNLNFTKITTWCQKSQESRWLGLLPLELYNGMIDITFATMYINIADVALSHSGKKYIAKIYPISNETCHVDILCIMPACTNYCVFKSIELLIRYTGYA